MQGALIQLRYAYSSSYSSRQLSLDVGTLCLVIEIEGAFGTALHVMTQNGVDVLLSPEDVVLVACAEEMHCDG